MTQEHPITPPPELVEQWCHKWTIANGDFGPYLATQAARWGADHELGACLGEIRSGAGLIHIDEFKLRACLADDIWTARRPKPPSLKEQALKELHHLVERLPEGTLFSDAAILRAIESLPS